jgi:VWFA-related protein
VAKHFPVSIALFAASMPGYGQSPAIIRVPVRIVTVPTAVVSTEGKQVRDLQADDFQLFDNERSQSIRLDYADEPVSLAIVVQNNDSVRAWLPSVRRIAGMIEALIAGETGDTSLTIFGDEVSLLQPLTGNSALLDKAFRSIAPSAGNQSHILDAIASAAKQLERLSPQRRRVVLLIAQSADVGSTSNLPDVLSELERNNISVYSLVMPSVGKELIQKTIAIKDAKSLHPNDIGIAASVDPGKLIPEIYRAGKAGAGKDDLTVLTNEVGGRRVPFRKLRDLEAGVSAIAEELHTEYILSYTPDHFEPGYHRIRVQVGRRGVVVRARPGYYVLQSDISQ